MISARTVLRWAGAALLIGMAFLHGRLWVQGYRSIDVIGPLFVLASVLAVVAAAAVLLVRRRYLPVVALAGAALAAGTAGGLLLSTRVPLFGFQESLAAQDAVLSLLVEGTATVVLVALAAVSRPRWPRATRSSKAGAWTSRW